MKEKKMYVAPMQELIEVRVERGFEESAGKDRGLPDYGEKESQRSKFN